MPLFASAFDSSAENLHSASATFPRFSADEAIRDAGLIFQGTVTKIQSRVALEMGPNYQADFYAFVIFCIERVFKGEVEEGGNSITIPFDHCAIIDFEKQSLTLKQEPSIDGILMLLDNNNRKRRRNQVEV